MDFVIGIFCVGVAAIAFWNAFTQKNFYAATFGNTPVEKRFRYPTWLGRIIAVLIALVALSIGVAAIVQGLRRR